MDFRFKTLTELIELVDTDLDIYAIEITPTKVWLRGLDGWHLDILRQEIGTFMEAGIEKLYDERLYVKVRD